MSSFKKWLVVSGSHRQNHKSFKKGSQFITDADMTKYNTLTYAPKYKLLGEATEAEILQFQAEKGFSGDSAPEHIEEEETEVSSIPPNDSLEAMTVAELKTLAEDEEIDLEGATKRNDILQRIREARASV